jgi:LysM repeat protein
MTLKHRPATGAHRNTLALLGLAALIIVVLILLLSQKGGSEAVTPTARLTSSAVPATTRPSGIPGDTPRPPDSIIAPTPSQFWHVVQAGESLSGLALFYGVPLQDLLTVNGLRLDSPIRQGQSIVIPLPPSQAGTWHTVTASDRLLHIAERYGVPIEVIVAANSLPNADSIYIGQRLRIPLTRPDDYADPTAIPSPTPLVPGELVAGIISIEWPRSPVDHDLETGYPLQFEHERFVLHYQPNSYANLYLAETVVLIETTLEHVEETLQVGPLAGPFDVYLAGTFFEGPYASQRGASFSREKRIFLLYDGSGSEAENAYFLARELTHMVAWQSWGTPASRLLSEGLATYTASLLLDTEGILPLDTLCAIGYVAQRIPAMSAIDQDWSDNPSHLLQPFTYFGAGCFAETLVSTYGLAALRELYTTHAYRTVTGATLAELDAVWQQAMAAQAPRLSLNPRAMSDAFDALGAAYEVLLSDFTNSASFWQTYAELDQARSALWRGNLDRAGQYLENAYEILGFVP